MAQTEKREEKKNTHHDTMNSWAQMGISSLISRERTFPCDDLPPGWGGAIFIYAYIKVYIGNATSHSLFTYPHDCQGSLARYKGHAYNNNRGKKERQRQADMFFFSSFFFFFSIADFPPYRRKRWSPMKDPLHACPVTLIRLWLR